MKIGLVCSHGGHLTEMMALMPALAGHELFLVTYESARAEELKGELPVYTLKNIGTSPKLALQALPVAWRVLRRDRPHTLLSTGSEIAIPFFALAKLLRIRTVFVESFCRVKTASKTGKVVYPVVDEFLVQWPDLLTVYGRKARYEGGLM